MPKFPIKSSITETQYEAQLRQAIQHAFPWLPADKITHQQSFSFKFGHATVTVDAEAKNNARSRADVLLRFKGEPLAIFELKRPGIKLTSDDEEQGLSYARMLHPRPPLVVVSNGKAVRILETETGAPWQAKTKSETALATLITRGVEVAQADLKRAVSTLMAAGPDIWRSAIRQVTSLAIEDLSGDWDEPTLPFASDFILPRKKTRALLRHLNEAARLITIEGDPLAGKSSVLRELAMLVEDDPQLTMLYIDADIGVRLFERISAILSDALEWPVTADEARQWLVNLSRANGPVLVLAIDNFGPDRDDLRRDIETLTSNQFGPCVRVVVAVDEAVADQITATRNSRTTSALGRRAIRLYVGPLDKDEFSIAMKVLDQHRLTFASGAAHSTELRKPWLLRAITANAVTAPEYDNLDLAVALSPVPGLEILELARKRFDVSKAPFARYRELAQAVLEDAQDATRAYQLKLELLNIFIVRRSVALHHLSAVELKEMGDQGLIRETRSLSGENIYSIRLPELMACELSNLIATELATRTQKDAEDAADWLAGAASNLPFGDIIAADALFNAAAQNHGLNVRIIAELRIRAPQRGAVLPGTEFAAFFEGLGIVNVTQRADGSAVLKHNGKEFETEPDPGPQITYDDVHPYQILSHLAGHPFKVLGTNSTPAPRLDPDLLIGVGSAPLVLRRPGADLEIDGLYVHDFGEDLSVVCHKVGIAEPITWSLVRFFGREDEAMRDQFIDVALEDPAPALLARLDIALSQTARSADKLRANWATELRKNRLKTLLTASISGFLHL